MTFGAPSRVIGVRALFLGGPPLEELPQRPELDAGIRAAVPVQQLHRPLLDIAGVRLLPAGLSRLAEQVADGEPAHCGDVARHR